MATNHAMGYPGVAVPSTKPAHPRSHDDNENSDSIICWCCCFIAFLVVVIVGLIFFCVLGVFVDAEFPEVTVTSASLANFNISSFPPLLYANFEVTGSIRNPSKRLSQHDTHVAAVVIYGSTVIAKASLPPFYQPQRSSDTFRAIFKVEGERLDPNIAEGMKRDRSFNGAVIIGFNLSATLIHRPVLLCPIKDTWTANCNKISIWFANNGTGTSGSTAIGPTNECIIDPHW